MCVCVLIKLVEVCPHQILHWHPGPGAEYVWFWEREIKQLHFVGGPDPGNPVSGDVEAEQGDHHQGGGEEHSEAHHQPALITQGGEWGLQITIREISLIVKP